MKLVNQDKAKRHYQNGLTLVELLIVIAIVGIIAGIGYPSYQNHITNTRHADAKVMLLEIMQLQRRYFTNNNTYTDKLVDDLNLPDAGGKKVETENEFYLITASKCDGDPDGPPFDCIKLTANASFGDGSETVTYNSKNEKYPASAW